MKDLNRLKMAHAILVNQKEMATHVARDIYAAHVRAKEPIAVQEAVDKAELLVHAINEKYDERILAAEKQVVEAMQEMQALQEKMQQNMRGPQGRIMRVPGQALDGLGG